MSGNQPEKAVFTLRVGYDQDELLGARWWQDNLRNRGSFASGAAGSAPADASRRQALQVLVGLGGCLLLGGVALSRCSSNSSPSSIVRDSIELQRERGAYADTSTSEQLAFPDPTAFDAAGQATTREDFDRLATDLQPDAPSLLPYYVPTLFQSLGAATNDRLRRDFRMIQTAAMQRAFGQGEAVRELLEHAERANAWALIVDLPGPESVAFAAGLRPLASTVFTFDNWPHPRGVVPAHLTLAAAVYHRPAFQKPRTLPPGPVVFVLDCQRLAPYQDDPKVFDNRYVVKLPTAEQLQARNVQRVLYVIPDGAPAEELADLNERFVAYRRIGIDVRLLSLTDITLGEQPTTPTGAASQPRPHYYWHGNPAMHWFFWNHYGWPSRSSGITPQAPTRSSFGSTWSPKQRLTPFNAGTSRLGQTRDSSPSSGGSSSGRSGSSGRSWFGGSS